MDKICAIIVTYNRLDLLKRCIESLRSQTVALDRIVIVDNHSTDGTGTYIRRISAVSERFETICLSENLGGAGGFECGIKKACQDGFDWLWIMDDDAEPADNCLEMLLRYKNRESVGLLAPVIVNKKTNKIQIYHHKLLDDALTKDRYISLDDIKKEPFLRIDANAFVGPLIAVNAIRKVGYPRGDFFIWLDDTEYTYRISRKMKMFLITDAVIYHNDQLSAQNIVHDFWKYCYGSRNRWLWRHSMLHGMPLVKGDILAYKDYVKQFVKIMVKSYWKKNRITGIKYLIRTIHCSQKQKTGKFIDPIKYYSALK